MILGELKKQDRSPGKTDIGCALKDCPSLDVTPARPGIDPPSRFILSIDRKLDRPSDALLARFILKVWLERSFTLLEVRGRFLKFHCCLVRGILCVHRLDLEFCQG